jgi:putative transposase
MPMKRYKPEQIVATGKTTPQACKEVAITQQTYYRWRKEFGLLSIKLCLTDRSSGLLKARLKHGIELRKS